MIWEDEMGKSIWDRKSFSWKADQRLQVIASLGWIAALNCALNSGSQVDRSFNPPATATAPPHHLPERDSYTAASPFWISWQRDPFQGQSHSAELLSVKQNPVIKIIPQNSNKHAHPTENRAFLLSLLICKLRNEDFRDKKGISHSSFLGQNP